MQRTFDAKLRKAVENQKQLNRFRLDYNDLIVASEGQETIRVLRIKAVGIIFYSALAVYLISQSEAKIEDISAIAVPILFAGSSLTGVIEESYRTVINNIKKAEKWKCLGAGAGSIAAGISVLFDAAGLIDKAKENGMLSLPTLLSAGKLITDIAFFINTTDVFLSAIEEKTIQEIILSVTSKRIGPKLIGFIGWLGTWQAMIIITFIQTGYELLVDNKIQVWCRESVLGNDSTINNTYSLNELHRNDLIKKQSEKLNNSLRAVFNIPESEEEKKLAEEQRKKNYDAVYNRYRLKY